MIFYNKKKAIEHCKVLHRKFLKYVNKKDKKLYIFFVNSVKIITIMELLLWRKNMHCLPVWFPSNQL